MIGERDGAFHQPKSVNQMMELILAAATGLFAKRHISVPRAGDEDSSAQKGVLDVFDESIRDVVSRVSDAESGKKSFNSLGQADREITLFNNFKEILAREEKDRKKTKMEGNDIEQVKKKEEEKKTDLNDSHCRSDNGELETNSICEETELLREIKDIRDELNILETLVEAQDTVWKQAFGIEKLENGPHFKYNHPCTPATVRIRLEYMIQNAQEVQEAVGSFSFSFHFIFLTLLPSLNLGLTFNHRFIPCWTCDKSRLA